VHQAFHPRIGGLRIDVPLGIERGHVAAFGGRLRVQREMHEHGLDVVDLLEFLNTHGTEIAPRSDVVGEDLEFRRLAPCAPPPPHKMVSALPLGFYARRASWIARQTRSAVAGISMCSTPSSASASTIALTTAPRGGGG